MVPLTQRGIRSALDLRGADKFPVVFEDLVIVSGVMTGWGDYAPPAHRFVAFDKRNGTAVWFFSTRLRPEDTTYSTPVFTCLADKPRWSWGGGRLDLCPATAAGKQIWQFDASTRGLNVVPLIVGDKIYFGHGEQNFKDQSILGAAFAFDANGTGNLTDTKLCGASPRKPSAGPVP